MDELLHSFAARVVQPEFHDRFLHEIRKKPGQLHTRICHSIDQVIRQVYKGGRINFEPSAQCYMLAGPGGLEATTWSKAGKYMNCGYGVLIIDASTGAFYAETEGMPKHPSEVYAG